MTESADVPSFLYAPPDQATPSPPVVSRKQSLPFQKLSWTNFERLIVRLIRQDATIGSCSMYGSPGEIQHGIDVLATRRGEAEHRACYQCKRIKSFRAGTIKGAIDKFMSGAWAAKASEFVLCASSPLTALRLQDELDRQRRRLGNAGIALSVWDGAPGGILNDRLKDLPELVDDFFGRPWVEHFNGPEVAHGLGVRLNGRELSELQARLLTLYKTIFAQHDPGLRTNRGDNVDFCGRYVPAYVVEQLPPTALGGLTDEPGVTPEDTVATPDASSRFTEGSGSAGPQRQARGAAGGWWVPQPGKLVLQWLAEHRNCLVLGEPGYGKSALLRYIALAVLQPEAGVPAALPVDYYRRLPMWISFARLADAMGTNSGRSLEAFFQRWLRQYSFEDVWGQRLGLAAGSAASGSTA